MHLELRREGGRAAFVPYVMAGDPDMETTERIVAALTACGAAAIELGVPYSDALADGPSIAAAGTRALAQGVTLAAVLASVARMRAAGSAPIVLFSYYNPVDRYGYARFARDAAAAGASGAILPDLALEESDAVRDALRANGLSMPLLIAPTTPLERCARIAAAATGFVYVVARMGVTGASDGFGADRLRARMQALRALTDLPLALGFGISQPEQVRVAAEIADAVIVGSALIDAYAGCSGEQAVRRVVTRAQPLVAACG